MDNNKERIIFHIDVNSAYLSWTTVKLLQYGSEIDIREVPSVIGGDEEQRQGITNKLLAKMASDFKPKNTVHTLFEDEVSTKMCTYKKVAMLQLRTYYQLEIYLWLGGQVKKNSLS